MSIYMKCAGINDDVSNNDYSQWIALFNFKFLGVAITVNTVVDLGHNRVLSRPQFHEIILLKAVDKSSISLFDRAHSAKPMDSVQIDFVTTGANPKAFLSYTLSKVLLSRYSTSKSHGQSEVLERIQLNYTEIEQSFTEVDSAFKSQSPMRSGYSVTKGVKL